MSRKHCRRQPVVPLPPRGLRPRFDASRLASIGIAHLSTLDCERGNFPTQGGMAVITINESPT